MLRSLPDYIQRHDLIRPGDRVGVAVSGGSDSVGLLRALLEARAELGIVLSVVHFNHKLRGEESEQDERFVGELSAKFDLLFHRADGDTRRFAREKELSLEAGARELRYSFFGRLIKEATLDKVATAHTLDDQAETVLLRIFRGTGTSGLAGILPRIKVGEGGIIRPFLSTGHAQIGEYLNALSQPWREDSSNDDTGFTRNRIRHLLMPFLRKSFNSQVADSLASLAEIARAEDEFWASETAEAFVNCTANGAIRVAELLKLPKALQRRVLRLAAVQKGASFDFAHGEVILDHLTDRSQATKVIELPNGFRALLSGNELCFEAFEPQAKPCGFRYQLPIPGEVAIPELQILIRASFINGPADVDGYNYDRRLAASRITSELVLRNWQPGDRFWPAHSRSEKKVKELLQERHVPLREKSLWPVVLDGDSIVWMRGFPVSAPYLAKDEPAILLEELPLFPDRT